MQGHKIFGLLLTFVFVINVVAPSATTADELTAEKYNTTLTGSVDPGYTDEFLITVGSVKCAKPTYIATISQSTTTVTVTALYSECTAGFPVAVDMNKCDYLFHIGGGESTEGTVDLVCPNAGEEVTITVTSAGTLKCTIHIKPQTGLGSVQYSMTGTGGITVNINILEKIHYSHTEGTGLGRCFPGTGVNGSLRAKAVVTGEEDKASFPAQVSLSLSKV